jgi:hypothetical protein
MTGMGVLGTQTNFKCSCNEQMKGDLDSPTNTNNLNPNTRNKNFNAKRRRYVTYHWQEKNEPQMKLRTCQVRKGGEGKVNRGWLRRDRGGRRRDSVNHNSCCTFQCQNNMDCIIQFVPNMGTLGFEEPTH